MVALPDFTNADACEQLENPDIVGGIKPNLAGGGAEEGAPSGRVD
jgi:hypothetical protein